MQPFSTLDSSTASHSVINVHRAEPISPIGAVRMPRHGLAIALRLGDKVAGPERNVRPDNPE